VKGRGSEREKEIRGRERDKKRQTDRHMTTDLECQEFQKRGERKREREREREERERHPTDVYASLFVLYHSHSLLSSCSHTLVA